MPISLDQFCDQLVSLGLVNDTTLGPLRAKLAGDENPVQTLARALVKEKKLTAYQAQLVYAGRGKSLSLGKYLVLDKIGEGGMGQVFKARHRTLDRIVAIKLLPPELTDSAEAIARFHREVRAAARLEHVNIVRAYDADEHQGAHFLVMEYVSGDDLSARVRSTGAMTVEQAVDCIRQAARGLEFAHAQGIIHRDIKPSNMLLDEHGVLRILDMGLARVESLDESTHSELTSTGQVMGTVDYMAPEQAVDTRMVDGRADIYSLGVTLYYLLCVRPMYNADTIVKKLMAHQTAEIPRLTSVRGDVPAELDRIFQKMVAKKPEERYPTMTALLEDLDRWNTTGEGLASPGPSRGELTAFDEFLNNAPFTARPQRSTKPIGPTIQINPVATGPQISPPTTSPATGNNDVTHVWNQGDEDTDPESAFLVSVPEPRGRQTNRRPKPTRSRRLPTHWIALGALLPTLLIAGVIIILIRNKDGSETRIEVPDDAEVQVIRSSPTKPPAVPAAGANSNSPPPPVMARWENLFADGKANGWETLGPFSIKEGLLVAQDGAANAISAKDYADFELEVEWRLGPNGNSGIYYREPAAHKILPGNEYQLLDDAAYTETQPPPTQTGSLYGMIAPASAQSRPIGEWNSTKIICDGTHVEHWLNGQRVVDYDTATAEWWQLVNASSPKYKDVVGTRKTGRILLQAHTGEVAFRLVRVRPLDRSRTVASMSRDAIEVLPALAGAGSLVPRPQAIPGLKSWDIVRVLPVGYCGGAVALPDGRIATSWSYQSGIFVHRKSDFRVEQVFLPNVSLSGAPLAVSHDGTQIVMGSSTYTSPPFTFSVVNLSTGQTTTIAAGSHAHRPCLAFSRDNQKIVSATYAGPSIWNLRESRLITGSGTPSNSQIQCVAWSPDESQAWTLNEIDTFRAYRSTDLSPIPEHPLANEKLEWFALSDTKESPSHTLAAITSDGTVRLFDTRDWSVSKSFQLEEPGAMSYTQCAWSPDATRLAVAFNRFVEIWDVANATRLHRIKADVSTMVWREQHLLCLHSVDTSQAIDTANGKVTPISFALVSSPTDGDSALSEDGARLLAESSNRVIEIDAEQGLPIWRSDPRNISNVRYSTDRKNIAVQTWSHETQIWRTEDQKSIKSLPGSSATWSPDDGLLAIREGNGLVKLYDTASWEVTQEFQYQAGERNTMSWSPDGRYLAIRVIPKSAIHFWDTVEQKLISVDSFPENGSENKQPWFEPKWRSNERLLVPFAKKFFEVGPKLTTPTLRFGAYEVQGFDYHRERQQTVIVGGGGFDIRDEAGERVFNSMLRTWGPPQWLPDGRRFFTPAWWFGGYPARGYDVDTRQSLGCCFPFIGEESWLTIGPTGHYQGSEGIESEFLYVAEHLDGHQQTYTPAEFAKTFNWKNYPQQATFLKLVETREVKPLADNAKSP